MVLAALLLSLVTPQSDARVRRLVGELDGLREDFTAEAFLKRPAIQELIALQEESAAALEEALRTSTSWSVRASAAYVLGEIRHSSALLERFAENHPIVRSFVLEALLKNNTSG